MVYWVESPSNTIKYHSVGGMRGLRPSLTMNPSQPQAPHPTLSLFLIIFIDLVIHRLVGWLACITAILRLQGRPSYWKLHASPLTAVLELLAPAAWQGSKSISESGSQCHRTCCGALSGPLLQADKSPHCGSASSTSQELHNRRFSAHISTIRPISAGVSPLVLGHEKLCRRATVAFNDPWNMRRYRGGANVMACHGGASS